MQLEISKKSPSLIREMWSDQIEISIVPVESTNLPSLTGRLEFCGVEASLSHQIKPETVTISPCLLVFKTSATDVMGGAAGGTYLNGMAIVETSLTMLFWCINTMPL